MDIQPRARPAVPVPSDRGGSERAFARRIDCAPAPRKPLPAPVHNGHGYGRAPAERA